MAAPRRKLNLSHLDASGRPRMVDVSAKAGLPKVEMSRIGG